MHENLMQDATFDQLWQRYDWREIANCPGRFVLRDGLSTMGPSELAGCEALQSRQYQSSSRDPVHVVRFGDGGGLISYQKPAGEFLHTLNTASGMERKLRALGIQT